MKTYKFVFMILVSITSIALYATIQIPDSLFYRNEIFEISCNPLEPFFEKYPDKRPELSSTALWRCYVATFTIIDSSLYVKDIESMDYSNHKWDEFKSIYNEISPNNDSMKVELFSGLILLKKGQHIFRDSSRFYVEYEKYHLLQIESGNLIKELELTHDKYEAFLIEQFLEFKKTKEYQKLKDELLIEFENNIEQVDNAIKWHILHFSKKILAEIK